MCIYMHYVGQAAELRTVPSASELTVGLIYGLAGFTILTVMDLKICTVVVYRGNVWKELMIFFIYIYTYIHIYLYMYSCGLFPYVVILRSHCFFLLMMDCPRRTFMD